MFELLCDHKELAYPPKYPPSRVSMTEKDSEICVTTFVELSIKTFETYSVCPNQVCWANNIICSNAVKAAKLIPSSVLSYSKWVSGLMGVREDISLGFIAIL